MGLGCAVIGLVEWYVLVYGVTDLDCALDPTAPGGCVSKWEPTPKPWLMAACTFAALAAVGIARIEMPGMKPWFGRTPALS